MNDDDHDPFFDVLFYTAICGGLMFLAYLAVESGALCPAFRCVPWGLG